MFAVIKSGGKQYKVVKDDQLAVEKLSGIPGSVVQFDEVLMICEDGKAPTIGLPLVQKAKVFAEVVEQSRSKKIVVFKKKRRQNYRRTKGHRQEKTLLKILEISPTGIQSKKPLKKISAAKNKKVVVEKTASSAEMGKKKAASAGKIKDANAKKKVVSKKIAESKKTKG